MPQSKRAIDTAVRYFSPRLMEALAAALEQRLAFVHAPMGFGKTEAAREALRRAEARVIRTPVLTGNAEVFWRDFCRVLHVALPGPSKKNKTLETLEALGYPADPVQTDAAREILARLEFPADSVLVFDDVHLLPESPGSEDGGLVRLCLLLARQGCEPGYGQDAFPRTLIISRHKPGAALADSVLKGLAAVTGPEHFTLNAAEIQEYYTRCGIRLDAAAAAGLRETTGGWISALYLYLLHYSQHGELASPAALHTLLASELFNTLPQTTCEMLLALSPLERFITAQARALNADAEKALTELVRRNAFISHDAATDSYTLHALFRDFLAERFKNLSHKQQQAVHHKNAVWFARHNDAASAVRFLHAAKRFDQALILLEKKAEHVRVTEANGQLMHFFRDCPPRLLDAHPGAAFRYAMAALSSRDYPVFGAQLARLEGYCAALPVDDPAANRWRGELELLRSFTKYNDITAMSAHHRQAGEYFAKAEQATDGRFSEKDARSRFFGLEPWTLGSPSVLYMFHRQPGALNAELAALRTCLPHYSQLTTMHGAGAEDIMLAEAHYNAGEFDPAAIACHRGMATAMEHGQTGLELCALFVFARLALLRGEYDQAMDLLRTMRERVEKKQAFSLLRTVDVCKGFLCACLGRLEDIPDWLRHSGDSSGEKRLYAFAGGLSYLVHGRALLLAGEYAALAGRFSQLLHSGVFEKNTLFTLSAQTYLAAAYNALGMTAEADTALRAALNLALPDKLYMPLAENADFLPQLATLRLTTAQAENTPDEGEGIARILKLATGLEKARKSIAANAFADSPPALTRRERELVRLAMNGMPYKDIADALGIAPTSVKRYFATLYKKFGISSREQLKSFFRNMA